MKTKFKRGDKVEVNGNKDARILDYYSDELVSVRLWDGLRHIGDVCVHESQVKAVA